MRLILQPPGRVVAGYIHYGEVNVLGLTEIEMRKIRGKEIAMILQMSMTSLNPVFTIDEQIAEVARLHEGLGGSAAWDRAVEMLQIVRIPNLHFRPPSIRASSPVAFDSAS